MELKNCTGFLNATLVFLFLAGCTNHKSANVTLNETNKVSFVDFECKTYAVHIAGPLGEDKILAVDGCSESLVKETSAIVRKNLLVKERPVSISVSCSNASDIRLLAQKFYTGIRTISKADGRLRWEFEGQDPKEWISASTAIHPICDNDKKI